MPQNCSLVVVLCNFLELAYLVDLQEIASSHRVRSLCLDYFVFVGFNSLRFHYLVLRVMMRSACACVQQTGLTPLMEAASGGYVEVGRVLLDKGADIAATPVPVSRDTALTIAADKGHHRFVELLLTRSVLLCLSVCLLVSFL